MKQNRWPETGRHSGCRWLVWLAAGWLAVSVAARARAQDGGATLPPGVQEVVKLAHAGISEDIILAQVKSTGASYTLTADQIIYLTGQGVSQTVIKSLLGNGMQATPAVPAPVAAAPVTPAPSFPASSVGDATPAVAAPVPPATPSSAAMLADYQRQLASYGTWLQVPGCGLCWQPSVAVTDPYWRPYFNQGHWIYTDAGWSWESDYPWGGVVFHYGRWTHHLGRWVWVPGYDYAPAWVSWRQTDEYCGWAPLPPEAVFTPGVGLNFHGLVAADIDFGLGPDAFVFVPYGHFWDYNLFPYLAGPELRLGIFRGSRVLNGYRWDGSRGRFIVEGLGRDRIGLFTHREVRIEAGHGAYVPGHDLRGDVRHDTRFDSHDSRDSHRDDRDSHRGW